MATYQGDIAALSPMKSTVRRCLFGAVDHDEVRRSHEQEMAILEKQDQLKYNFNFHSETPLFGRYIWQRVAALDSDVPRCYEMATQFGDGKEVTSTSPSSSTDTTTSTTASSTVTADTSRTECEISKENVEESKPSTSSRKRKQSLISGCFSHKKKRHCTVGTAKRRLRLDR